MVRRQSGRQAGTGRAGRQAGWIVARTNFLTPDVVKLSF